MNIKKFNNVTHSFVWCVFKWQSEQSRKKQTTTFCLSTSLKDTFGAVVIVKKRIYRVCTTVYPATITEDKTDDNTLHIYIFWVFIKFYEFCCVLILKVSQERVVYKIGFITIPVGLNFKFLLNIKTTRTVNVHCTYTRKYLWMRYGS